jgi:ornithine cyclodeaminase/alanine dehydrogenase-like protein (mu-crystallin family)
VRECIDVMARAFAGLARGEATLPLRQILWLSEKSGALGLMPAHLSGLGAVGLKAVTFFPRNEGTDIDSHQGAVLLFETGRGGSSPCSTRRPDGGAHGGRQRAGDADPGEEDAATSR